MRLVTLVLIAAAGSAVAGRAFAQNDETSDSLDLTMRLLPDGARSPEAITKTIELPPSASPTGVQNSEQGRRRADDARRGPDTGNQRGGDRDNTPGVDRENRGGPEREAPPGLEREIPGSPDRETAGGPDLEGLGGLGGENPGQETSAEARERGREFGQEVAEQARENRDEAGRDDPPGRPDRPGPPAPPTP